MDGEISGRSRRLGEYMVRDCEWYRAPGEAKARYFAGAVACAEMYAREGRKEEKAK